MATGYEPNLQGAIAALRDLMIANNVNLAREPYEPNYRGLVDAVIERDIKIWDIAAVEPIINKAGGIITTWDGKSIGSNDTVCASSNSVLHNILLKKLQKFL